MNLGLALVVALGLFGHSYSAQAAEGFHNIRYEEYYAKIADWESRGLGAAAFGVYLTTEGPKAIGFYDEASKDNVTRALMSYQKLETESEKLLTEYNYAPKSLSVFVDGRWPRFAAVYAPAKYPTFVDSYMSDYTFNRRWQEYVVQKGYRVQDHVVFWSHERNRPYHAVIFVKDDKPFRFVHGLNAEDFSKVAAQYGNDGWVPETIHVGEHPTATYSGVWVQPTESASISYWDMSPEFYQAKFAELLAQGYRLKHVQGYYNSYRFAAIWVK